jgi:hypothetical protein
MMVVISDMLETQATILEAIRTVTDNVTPKTGKAPAAALAAVVTTLQKHDEQLTRGRAHMRKFF